LAYATIILQFKPINLFSTSFRFDLLRKSAYERTMACAIRSKQGRNRVLCRNRGPMKTPRIPSLLPSKSAFSKCHNPRTDPFEHNSKIIWKRNMCRILSSSVLFLLTQLSCFPDGGTNTLDQQHFLNLLATITPWQSGLKEDYTAQDLDRLVNAARIMQKFTPSSVQNVLEEWQTNQFGFDDSRAYLLFRVMFALPEHAPAREQFGFGWWMQTQFPDQTPINKDGTVNLAWPISWNNGRPYLVSGFQGYEGPPYRAAAEFAYLTKHYKYRDLSQYKGP